MKTAVCLGGLGFIGHHMARRLKSLGYWVRVVDIKPYEYGEIDFADDVVISDLRNHQHTEAALRLQGEYSFIKKPFEEVYQFDLVFAFCCNMGGAGYVFTGENDAEIISDSALMNINIAKVLADQKFKGKLFYSSSACIYPQQIQEHSENPGLKESDAWPANPDSVYGLEKIFSEKLYESYAKNHGLNIRIARFHNIYGPEGTYTEPRAKAPAAMCRKVIQSVYKYTVDEDFYQPIEVWGTGTQTRSFLYVEDCIDAVLLLMDSDYTQPINIGSEEMVSINVLADLAIDISGKRIAIKNIKGPIGVQGRNSDNTLIRKVLNGWEPKYNLRDGLTITYNWIKSQIEK